MYKVKLMLVLLLGLLLTPVRGQEFGSIAGRIISEYGVGLAYVNVMVYQGARRITGTQTKISGEYILRCPPGDYKLRASIIAYANSDTIMVSVESDRTTPVPTLSLAANPIGIIDILPSQAKNKSKLIIEATDTKGNPIPDASFIISQDQTTIRHCYSDASGKGAQVMLKEGGYSILVKADGYRSVIYKKVRITQTKPYYLSALLKPISATGKNTPKPRSYHPPKDRNTLSRLQNIKPVLKFPYTR